MHGYFLSPRGGAAKKQVGNIGAGDQQDEHDRPQKNEQHRTRFARYLQSQRT